MLAPFMLRAVTVPMFPAARAVEESNAPLTASRPSVLKLAFQPETVRAEITPALPLTVHTPPVIDPALNVPIDPVLRSGAKKLLIATLAIDGAEIVAPAPQDPAASSPIAPADRIFSLVPLPIFRLTGAPAPVMIVPLLALARLIWATAPAAVRPPLNDVVRA